ncbi:hypothetical protein [Haloglomus litoreum]|uniref:hypothetical protein n=1 Tax=Haloglomus litoreum TaxID=3034026 RepID=UPI0023E801D7|nr:hypothetical protein [Haloglomus sp. DT116]
MTESRRPALRKLAADQRTLVEDLHAGFETREDVLLWLQRVAVRSLGYIPDEWFQAVALRPDVLDDLVGDSDIEQFRRGQLGDVVLHRAFRTAFHRVRERVHEYTDSEKGEQREGTPDPERQKFIAMRPELSATDRAQHEALVDLFEGFSDREAIRLWVHDLRPATEGNLPASFLEYCCYTPMGYDPLVAPPDDGPARTARENLAATVLLPAMNRGIRTLQSGAEETVETVTDSHEPLST